MWDEIITLCAGCSPHANLSGKDLYSLQRGGIGVAAEVEASLRDVSGRPLPPHQEAAQNSSVYRLQVGTPACHATS